jgi:hypothetical protein
MLGSYKENIFSMKGLPDVERHTRVSSNVEGMKCMLLARPEKCRHCAACARSHQQVHEVMLI